MARLPTVAIIGRPNTGKSTLFNRLVGTRRAIESEIAGTTRDQVAHKVETDEMDYLLLDTGGMGGGSTDKDFEEDVSAQSLVALAAADVIVFTVNSKEDITASDERVAELLRKKKKAHVPVIIAVTKCDRPDIIDDLLPQYFAFGLGDDVIGVSATHNTGVGELEDLIIEKLKDLHFGKEDLSLSGQESRPPRIAIVGKPNVGKSSVVNALMSDPQRETHARIVSPIPGTTRDSSDIVIRSDNKEYVFVDTAGLRRKSKVEEDLEYLSNIRSIQAVEDSDIVVLMMDATEVVSRQDKRIASLAIESGKGLLIVLNKADRLSGEERGEKEVETRASLPFCTFAPLLFTSATRREGLPKLFPVIESIARNRLRRIPTKELLRWYEDTVHGIPANMLAKSKFITQADEIPPTFVIFVRDPKKVNVSQLRYLDNRLRETFAFEGTPVKWVTKKG